MSKNKLSTLNDYLSTSPKLIVSDYRYFYSSSLPCRVEATAKTGAIVPAVMHFDTKRVAKKDLQPCEAGRQSIQPAHAGCGQEIKRKGELNETRIETKSK
jgi:hypothetical protein